MYFHHTMLRATPQLSCLSGRRNIYSSPHDTTHGRHPCPLPCRSGGIFFSARTGTSLSTSSDDRTRTCVLWIMTPALNQLSYAALPALGTARVLAQAAPVDELLLSFTITYMFFLGKLCSGKAEHALLPAAPAGVRYLFFPRIPASQMYLSGILSSSEPHYALRHPGPCTDKA